MRWLCCLAAALDPICGGGVGRHASAHRQLVGRAGPVCWLSVPDPTPWQGMEERIAPDLRVPSRAWLVGSARTVDACALLAAQVPSRWVEAVMRTGASHVGRGCDTGWARDNAGLLLCPGEGKRGLGVRFQKGGMEASAPPFLCLPSPLTLPLSNPTPTHPHSPMPHTIGEACELDSCPQLCNGRAPCVNGTCSCPPGWAGEGCERRDCGVRRVSALLSLAKVYTTPQA